ncbi:MAG: PEGA domain-containing protein, partial [Vicinamibacterales bacterium]
LLVGAVALLVMLFQPPAPRQEAVSARSAPVRAPRAMATPTPARPEEAASPSEPRGAEAPVVVEETPAARAMEAPPVLGVLRIESDVPGAQVFIDRRFIGAAPATAEDVTPGTHQLNVSAEGFDSVAMPIDVAPGQRQIVVKLREVRLDSAIDVVHRHGVGSCRGRLIATPTGLRYETSNRDDAFTTASLDLEIFQVDYLAKNLRVKLPKGRQFNFTDPDGNADRLFVFHRDVENARERLRKGNRPATN